MSFLLLMGIFVFILVGAYAGYKFWQKSSLEGEFKKIEKFLAESREEILQYQNKNLLEAISAKQVLNEVKDEGMKWSKVIKKIRATLPEDKKGLLVEILAYSAANNSNISLNMRTVAGRETPYFDVAKLIRSFDDSDFFEDNFVPSISGGTDDQGRQILSFVLSTKYLEPSEDAPKELESALGDILEEATENNSADSQPVLR